MSLAEDTSQRSDRDLALLRHDGGIDNVAGPSHKLDVATLLIGFDEPDGLKSALDFAEGRGLSRPNLNLDGAKFRRTSGVRWLELKL